MFLENVSESLVLLNRPVSFKTRRFNSTNLTLLLFSQFILFVVLISKRKREGRDKGEGIDKFHLLCALFCLSFSFIHLSSIIVFALPVKNVILSISPPPSLSLLFNDKNTIKLK